MINALLVKVIAVSLLKLVDRKLKFSRYFPMLVRKYWRSYKLSWVPR